MNKIIGTLAIAFCTGLLVSCKNKTSINVEIPSELQNNKEVVDYINQYAETVSEFKAVINELGFVPNGENSQDVTKAINMSNFEIVKLTMKMSSITGELQNLKDQRNNIDLALTSEQIKSLDAICLQLDTHMAHVGDNTIDLSEIAAVQEKQAKKRAQGDSLTQALNELRGGPLGEASENGSAKSSNEISPKVAIPIMVLAFLFIAFFSIKGFIKRIKGTVQDISHSAGSIKNTAHDLLNDPKKVTGQDKELSAEENAGLEFLEKHLN